MQTNFFSTLCSIEHLTRAWSDVKAKRAGGGFGEQHAQLWVRHLVRPSMAGPAARPIEPLRQPHPRPTIRKADICVRCR